MAVICPEHDLLFLMAPRTGCTAVGTQVLLPRFGGEWLPPEAVADDDGTLVAPRKHTTLAQLYEHGFLTPAGRADLHVFVTVRNPFDSLVSLYEKMRGKYADLAEEERSWVHRKPGYVESMRLAAEADFSTWLLANHRRRGWRRRRPGPRHMNASFLADVDTVLRFESLQQDLTALFDRLGIDGDTTIPRHNTTDRDADWRSYYTPQARRVVEQVYAPDLERFGYGFRPRSDGRTQDQRSVS